MLSAGWENWEDEISVARERLFDVCWKALWLHNCP